MINNLTLLIPVKNEKESLGIFLKKLSKFNYKTILVVDKHDNTDYLNIVKNLKKTKIFKSKKTGYGNALIEGINRINTKYFASLMPMDL